MRDFQGQLCFTNPVIMPLKILIVLAMVNCDLWHGEAWKVSTSAWGRAGRRAGVPSGGKACVQVREVLQAGESLWWRASEQPCCHGLWCGGCVSA